MKTARCFSSAGVRLMVILVFAAANPVQAQSTYGQVFIFGDSLSDAGNIYQLTGDTSKAPYALVPSLPYAIGGHHFSNGKTWAERLAQDLQDNKGGKASLSSPGKNGNYAHGGARARSNSGSSSPSSLQQAWMFVGDRGSAPANALFVIQFGGNDLRDALVAGASDPSAVGPILQAAVSDIAGTIQALYAAGARNFLVANAPNLEHAPAVRLSGAAGIAGFLTGLFNGGLEGALQQLEAIPGITIHRLDFAGFTDAVVADPASFGMSNVSSPCLNFMVTTDAKCENPESYLFWDGLHPTAAAHKALADAAMAALNGN